MIQRMVSCMFPTDYLYGQKVEVVTLVLSCQDAVSLTAAGHQLSRWDWTENTVRRLSLQACSSLCRETKLHHDNVGSKPCDQKDQKIKGWSSATSIHQRWWPENLMVCIEQGKKKKKTGSVLGQTWVQILPPYFERFVTSKLICSCFLI